MNSGAGDRQRSPQAAPESCCVASFILGVFAWLLLFLSFAVLQSNGTSYASFVFLVFAIPVSALAVVVGRRGWRPGQPSSPQARYKVVWALGQLLGFTPLLILGVAVVAGLVTVIGGLVFGR